MQASSDRLEHGHHDGEPGETALRPKASSLLHLAYPVAVLTLAFLAPTPARADFFDGARQTFTVDIPHFFQDDIPCFFGGQPTSGAKKSCRPAAPPAKPATAPPATTNESTPPSSGH